MDWMKKNVTGSNNQAPAPRRQAGDSLALKLADFSSFWVGTERKTMPYGTIHVGPMFVQKIEPAQPRYPLPVLLVHGGGGQMVHYMGLGGMSGWAHHFVQAGYTVYLVDRPGHGRSVYHPDALGEIGPLVTYDLLTRDTVTSAKAPNKQWPGTTGDVGDPLVDQLVAAANSTPRNAQLAQDLWRRHGAELVDRIGPCVILTHSAGGPFGWLVANERPNLVKAVASFEGATAPLVGAGGAPGTPLPGLKNMPVMYLLADRGGRQGGPIIEALTQSGAKAELIELKARGILGNSHFAMFENNRRQVFEVIKGWIEKAAPSPDFDGAGVKPFVAGRLQAARGPARGPALRPPCGVLFFSPSRLFALTASAGAQRYTPGRTPWGDPDLQGDYTNSNEYATPLERPDRFAGKRLEDFTPAELAAIRRDAEKEAIDGLAPGPRGPDYWWLENLDLKQRRQPWLVVDPPDGRIPPLTANGRRRAQAAGRPKSSFLGGPFNGPDDLGLLERCISRGVPGSMIPVMYGNNYQIFQTPGFVVITYEIIHEARVIPLDGRPHVGAASARTWATRAGTGRAARWSSRPPTSTPRAPIAAPTRARCGSSSGSPRCRPPPSTGPRRSRIAQTWERPWTIAMPLTHDPRPVMPFECHEGNYGLVNILKAARAADAR